uniref:STAS domain-containing protein n=1 Tax=Chrysemys picta bellii TaxID=8478 RepID=A0A8C3HYI5_CHRPI
MSPGGTSWPDVSLPRLPSEPALSFQAVWVVTWLAVVVLNVDVGLAVGVVFSMMTVICRTQRYRSARRPVLSHGRARLLIPGVKIMAYHAPIYYGNRDFFREALSRQLGLSQPRGGRGEKALRALESGAQISTVVRGPVPGAGGPWGQAGIHMNLAACNGEVLETLTSSGLGQHLSPQQVFVTVQDALASITQTTVRGLAQGFLSRGRQF